MSYSSEVLADSPLAYWRLGEPSGTSAADSSGNSRTATYTNSPTLGASSLLLSDTGNTAMGVTSNAGTCTSIASASWMNVSTISVECWVYLTSATDAANGDAIVTRYAAGGFNWLLWRTPAGKWGCQLSNAAGATKTIAGTVSVSLSTVYHLVMTYDGTTMILYVNGTAVDTLGSMGGGIFAGATPIEVGRYSSANSTTPSGTIDEVAIYSGALSAARVLAHYTAGTVTGSAATGTGSLTLSGSGDGAAPTAGTGTLSLSGSGTTSAPAAGSGSLSLSGAGIAAGPSDASGTGSLSLSATGTAVAAAIATGTGSLSLSGSGIIAGSPSASGSLDLFGAGAAAILYAADTSNFMSGLSIGASASVTVTTPVGAPDPTAPVKVDKAIALPTPTIVNGRPT